MRKLLTGVVVAALLVLSGCASVPMASKDLDAQAKTFTSTTDKASLYIYRDESMGAAIKMPVLVDGVLVGDTAAHTYIYKSVEPGRHVIVSKTENDPSLSIDMKAGETYFVWQEVKMGFASARSALHQVDEVKGRAAVQQCKLVQPL